MSEWTIPAPLTLFAPAKVNLGLEVCGRRPDGYHDVVTVMESVSIFDRIEIHPAPFRIVHSDDRIIPETDLITRALEAVEKHTEMNLCLQVTTRKAIPVSAGLGGGSSDAGTLIAALGSLMGLGAAEIHNIASSIGSDVPFFINGGMALATGTGTDVEPVEQHGRRWFLIILPDLDIPGKTGRLYSQLSDEDFTDGTRTRQIATGRTDPNDGMINTFQRPLLQYEPVKLAYEALQETGCSGCIPSGAGPSVFAVFTSYSELVAASSKLDLPPGARMLSATSVGAGANQSRIDAVARLG